MPEKTIQDVLKEHTKELLTIPGVVGTAIGLCDKKPCIRVYVVKKTSEIDQKIPAILKGFPIEVEETGEFKPI